MSGFLFVVPPLTGHVNPLVGVAALLGARGHRVAWVCPDRELIRRLAGPDAVVFSCDGQLPLGERPSELRGPEALKFLWERFLLPLARSMAPGVDTAMEIFGPDVVVADQQAFAGPLTAERRGLPWAVSASTSAELTDPLAGLPKVREWIGNQLAQLRRDMGVPAGIGTATVGAPASTISTPSGTAAPTPGARADSAPGTRSGGDTFPRPAAAPDPRFSPHLTLAFTTPELAGPAEGVRWVGPSLADRPNPVPFPWSWLDPARATVLVSLGTVNAEAGGRFLEVCWEVARERAGRIQTVLVDPAGALNAAADGAAPDDDVLIVPSVPQLALLAKGLDAVVCHAGHNTVCEALWHGVPLVVAPIRDDQPVVAGQVVDAGAGVRVRFGRAGAGKLGAALDAVLGEPGYREAAGRIGAAFRAAGGAPAAVAHLEELLREAP